MLTWHALLISSSALFKRTSNHLYQQKATATEIATATIVGSIQRRYTKKGNRSIMAFSNQIMALALVLSLSLALPSALGLYHFSVSLPFSSHTNHFSFTHDYMILKIYCYKQNSIVCLLFMCQCSKKIQFFFCVNIIMYMQLG